MTPIEKFDKWLAENRSTVMVEIYQKAEQTLYLSRAEVDTKIQRLRWWLETTAKGQRCKYHDWAKFITRNLPDKPFKANKPRPTRSRGLSGPSAETSFS